MSVGLTAGGLPVKPVVEGRLVPALLSYRWALLGILLLIAAWWVAHLVVGVYLPAPWTVASTALLNLFSSHYMQGLGLPEGGYLPHLLATTKLTLAGVSIGYAVGICTGLLSSRYRVVNDITLPIVAIFGTIPILIASPFFTIWFGLSLAAKIALIAFYSATLIHIYMMRALAHVHPAYREYALTLGATDNAVFRSVLFPAALPELFGGLRLALMNAWGLAAIVELMGSQVGVGRLISAAWSVYDTTAMMAAVLWLSVIAVFFDALLVQLRAYLTRWSETHSRSEY